MISRRSTDTPRPAVRRLIVAITLLALITTGCQLTSDADPLGRADDPDMAESPSASAGVAPAETAEAEESGGDLLATGPCEPATIRAISEVIDNQLDAFAAADFAGALKWATPGFRQSFTPQSFGDMITSSFPVPASATGHQIIDCSTTPTVAVVGVRVSGDAGEQNFQYALQLLEEGWRIEGAVPAGEAEPRGEVI